MQNAERVTEKRNMLQAAVGEKKELRAPMDNHRFNPTVLQVLFKFHDAQVVNFKHL